MTGLLVLGSSPAVEGGLSVVTFCLSFVVQQVLATYT
jgi:hypothetical protein